MRLAEACFAAFPSAADHRYFYARWTGERWVKREITKAGGVERVRLDAPQRSAAFFQHQGFKLVAGGPDRVEMMMKLAVCP